MGFFKKLFKKKKGGTFFGNLLRKGANVATGGILGSGAGLAARDARDEQREYDAAVAAQDARNAAASRIGTKIGTALQPTVKRLTDSAPVQDAKKAFTKAWFKKNMMKIIGGVVALIGTTVLIMWLFKKKGGKR
ncbi:hypothetical protein [Changchengzhania lutea]|uniref:hypothetical protein n=1 Tax=Changchengzhania lutea TaxID=2049305 RepID=UPI00115E1D1A|nr:hypothetical protein [Changchengzhania lutea]